MVIYQTPKMSEIYLRDDKFARLGYGPRLTPDDIRYALDNIRSQRPFDIKQVNKGYILKFHNDKDVNYIMCQPTYSKLQQQYLTPDLSKDTRFHREVIALDVPESILELPIQDLQDELQVKNNIHIMKLTKFTSEYSNRHFIKMILDTRASKEQVIRQGIVYLFQARLHVRNTGPPPPDRSSARQPTVGRSSGPNAATFHHQGPLLSRASNWANANLGNGSQRQHTSTTANNTPQGHQATSLNDPNLDFNLKAFDLISARLSQGQKNPEIYMFIFNSILSHNGYPEINFPKDILITDPSKSNANATTSYPSPDVPSTPNLIPPTPAPSHPTLAPQAPVSPTPISPVISDLKQIVPVTLALPPLASLPLALPHDPKPKAITQSPKLHADPLPLENVISQLSFDSSTFMSPSGIPAPLVTPYLNEISISTTTAEGLFVNLQTLTPTLTGNISKCPSNTSTICLTNILQSIFTLAASNSPNEHHKNKTNKKKAKAIHNINVTSTYKMRPRNQLNNQNGL